ncbi:hypothetical protein EC900105_1499 [Escherichia coli 900105 (10e)]|nr:hypothetical protein EC900105_1499 [Escherichia coli 900105 (10e)]
MRIFTSSNEILFNQNIDLSKIYLFIISLSFALILFPFWVKSIIFQKLHHVGYYVFR